MARHSRFFGMLPKMKKQTGVLVLREAGVPRFSHVVRSLPPRITDTACALFDHQIESTFASIAGFNPSLDMTKNVVDQMHLPLR